MWVYPLLRGRCAGSLLLVALLVANSAIAQRPSLDAYAIPDPVPLVAEVVARNLDLPWDLVWGPDSQLWFTERTGALKRYDPSTREIMVLDTVPGVFNSTDNSGLHALLLHPNFAVEPWIYVSYTYTEDNLRLSRFWYGPEGLQDEEILLEMAGKDSHNGARLLLDQTGKLLFATGDAYNPFLPQDSLSPNGKLLRLELDGSIPVDNPFPGNALYTLGHRNMQGLVQLPNGEIWSTEHGEDADDELNRHIPSRNYGWPDVAGACDAADEAAFCEVYAVVEPHLTWTPTAGPSGLDYYDHPAIPQWQGCLIAGFLKRRGDPGQRIRVIQLDDDGLQVLGVRDYLHEGPVVPTDLGQPNQIGVFGRIRDVLTAPDGSVYLCTSNREFNGQYALTEDDDRIIRIYNPAWNPVPCLGDCLSIYPSPVRSGQQLYLKFGESITGAARVSLFNVSGQRVLDAQVTTGPFIMLPLNALSPGPYVLEVIYPDGKQIRSRKILVLP
ncbi:MAG: T9SS type A sorting domain-containing protein [Bacteroidetes bacterium]|nr:T9SS type A sorting domain-containing protein [Bacteroidota bacterium]